MLFFFNDTAPTEIYTLSLHDALPIYRHRESEPHACVTPAEPISYDLPSHIAVWARVASIHRDRKSTRLNSSHVEISYAVFCLKKKKKKKQNKQKINYNKYIRQRTPCT